MGKIEKNWIRIGLIILVVIMVLNMNAQNLKKHKWENRVLIVQTFSESSTQFLAQLDEFKNSAEALEERKLILYTVVGDKYRIMDFQDKLIPYAWKSWGKLFNKILNKNDDFKVILIGLDGGVKLEKTDLLKRNELFRIIDSMPMRSAELRNKK